MWREINSSSWSKVFLHVFRAASLVTMEWSLRQCSPISGSASFINQSTSTSAAAADKGENRRNRLREDVCEVGWWDYWHHYWPAGELIAPLTGVSIVQRCGGLNLTWTAARWSGVQTSLYVGRRRYNGRIGKCATGQEIRSVELGVCPMQLFYIWSRDVHPVQNLLLCTKFHENRMIFHWYMSIYQFSKWRPSAILESVYHHTRPPTKSMLLAAAACQISCQSDTHVWRYYSYLIFLHIWLEIPIQAPKIGVLGDFGPLNVIIHHRDPQKAHSCVNPRFLSYQL